MKSKFFKNQQIEQQMTRQSGIKTINFSERTMIMGILNLTPDSFSGDGVLQSGIDNIISRVEKMIADGADIIDIGAESTRPGATPISTQEEIDRIQPVLEAIISKFDTLISVDTYKAAVARLAIKLGVTIINDISAMKSDPDMADIIAESGAYIVLMHNSSNTKLYDKHHKIGGSFHGIRTEDIISYIKSDFESLIQSAVSSGISEKAIILDPGFGFGKSLSQNLEILARFSGFSDFGLPLLSAPSRKSFIGHVLNLPPDERLEGTMAAIALSIDKGASIVRVHDVKEARRVAGLTDAVRKYGIT